MKQISKKVMRDMEKAGKQLLSDEELNFINGGERCGWVWGDSYGDCSTISEDWCIVDYCCLAAIMHPDDHTSGDACWADYYCVIVNH